MGDDISAFLTQAGWPGATPEAITPDWSPRHFWRVRDGERRAVLIHAPQPVPGHGLDEFAALSAIFVAGGLSTPEVMYRAPGFLLVEDFGVVAIDRADIEDEAYTAAVDALGVLRGLDARGLTAYRDGYIYKKLALFSDAPEWLEAWQAVEVQLPPCPHVFGHMDYKAGNLHWLPERQGVRRVGILDFQAAQSAPFVYDIVNLLEDARRNIAPDLKERLKQRFKAGLPADWQGLFDDWYVVIAAQFHARVLGQVRGAPRVSADVAPRLEAYLRDELQHPLLAPLRKFFA